MKPAVIKSLLLAIWSLLFVKVPQAQLPGFYEIEAKTIDGESIKLETYKGKVLLIVNVASNCGFTRQYEGLERIYDAYKDRGFFVLGFPSNDFGGQEPGTEAEIKSFCSTKFGASFPLFSKVNVLGENKHPLYQFLCQNSGGKEVSWNFEKFLIGKNGQIIARYSSFTTPESDKLKEAIEKALAE